MPQLRSSWTAIPQRYDSLGLEHREELIFERHTLLLEILIVFVTNVKAYCFGAMYLAVHDMVLIEQSKPVSQPIADITDFDATKSRDSRAATM